MVDGADGVRLLRAGVRGGLCAAGLRRGEPRALCAGCWRGRAVASVGADGDVGLPCGSTAFPDAGHGGVRLGELRVLPAAVGQALVPGGGAAVCRHDGVLRRVADGLWLIIKS